MSLKCKEVVGDFFQVQKAATLSRYINRFMKHILNIGWLYLIICFSSLFLQFKNAGIIEMEASIKACRVLIMQQVRVVDILQYQSFY